MHGQVTGLRIFPLTQGKLISIRRAACLILFSLSFFNSVLASTGRETYDSSGGSPLQIDWQELENGLQYAEIPDDNYTGSIAILKIDPNQFDFVLKSVGKNNEPPKTLAQWTMDQDLTAAINASMYLPDGKTSTGYMRFEDYINNPRIVKRFGAFFVASPKSSNLPEAQIIETDDPDWEIKIASYDLVIQNYRMTSGSRKILWSPGGPLYSISAVAQTGDGHILFLHSRNPVEAHGFIRQLLRLPLDIRTMMYVEGGGQAGLAVNSQKLKKFHAPPHAPSLLVTGNITAVLPNVIGIRPKK